MDFKENKAIYLQIAERICDEILLDKHPETERIPSVREYASIVEVNFNTVMRSFESLQSQEIIYNKRGIGYFVADGAKNRIKEMRKNNFLKSDINDFFKQIYTLDITMEDVMKMYEEYKKNQ
ncbi:GntR family transcriptional regulator [Dysgonomonas sp. 216]|uniref:GntR family transcriptional regulator n=1 Tax=Dysgonomonas sp. 216 TaxID=2302934 RepID=UPI0013D08250|nr:GntR family transcriptional regulator [Dysgonomonas sp. 216]NDW18288.1 GntR family transcriptional regulator [Dysgonomonas sp. 216]NDW18656.1 GntR family transcriptional regulator [Dysgonomonas sp. 216]